MLDKVWFWLVVIGITYGFAKGGFQEVSDRWDPPPAAASEPVSSAAEQTEEATEEEPVKRGLVASGEKITEAAIDSAQLAVELCFKLIGIMALWLGLMQVANDAGLVESVAKLLRPAMRWLFPDVPDGHPAQGSIVMNLAANMLGLENAATPMGLKAMQDLEKLNPHPGTATNAMAMFLAINTSNVTLIPIATINYRAAYGSAEATQPLMGTLLVTTLATVVAIVAAKWLSKLPRYQIAATDTASEPSTSNDKE